MKTLSEHNARQMERYEAMRKMQEPHANGIACPNCGAELWDSKPMMMLASSPPQKHVHCTKCDYRGYRLA